LNILTQFDIYIKEIAKVKDELEHSGRTFLQNLLQQFAEKTEVIHEPKRDKNGKGAPDFKFVLNGTDIGFLENKKIGENLDEVLKSKQIEKYKTLTDNLILTDYLRWIWIYKDAPPKEIILCEKSELSNKNIKLDEQKCNELAKLITDFLSQTPEKIVKARDLAEKLSKPTRTIKDEINTIVQTNNATYSKILGTYKVFKESISENITPSDFADAFAQTLTYSLFLTKITQTVQPDLTLSNIANLTPKSFALIKDILSFINDIENYPQLEPYIERIFFIINNTNAFEVVADLQKSKDEFEDAYIHFYENFLTAYDPIKRKDLGVWYTPKPVVRSIIDNIHNILQQDFNLAEGLADMQVKVLDFACGTGTFLFEVYDKILSTISKTSLKKQDLIKNHILKNIFGFELLIPAYCVSHLKLSQHLQTQGYSMQEADRIRVYFTNTLENRNTNNWQGNLSSDLFPAIAKEGQEAQQIKDDNDILVITGNPPYNVRSKNILSGDLLIFHNTYKPNDESKINIDDDYIKFIAFAHRKIKLTGRGVFGLIVNNSFLSGLTHRKMRNELMKDFDKIYIINLHGGGEINGIKDENVFAIKKNVCIAIFVKNNTIEDKGVFYTDLIGKRLEKFKALPELDRKSFEKLEIDEFNKAFKSTSWGKNRFADNLSFFYPMREAKAIPEYGEFVGLTDIFEVYGSGLETGDNRRFIHFKDDFQESIHGYDQNKVKKITCIPLDTRYCYYDNKLLSRAAIDRMQHMLKNDNICLSFVRQVSEDEYNHTFISDNIVDRKLMLSEQGAGYIAPLYLHKQEATETGWKDVIEPNFKPEFIEMLRNKGFKPLVSKTEQPIMSEQILAYIYAVLHSPNYRTKYLEFLKIDFPRINFDVGLAEFTRLSTIGQELIDAHLMRKIPKSKIGEPESDGVQDFIASKVAYNEEKQRLYFNKTCYFADVSPAVWNFKIGGYQVLDKYLKSRKGLDIFDDLSHIQKIIKSLQSTIEIMQKIDLSIAF